MADHIAYNLLAASGKLDAERAYWRDKLQGDLSLSAFPTDCHSAVSERAYAEQRFPVEPEIAERMVRLSSGSDHALYVILLAGVNLLLSMYGRTEEAVVGMPVFRQNAGAGSFLTRLLLLRTSLAECRTFKGVLLQTRQTVMDANQHQNFPIEEALKLGGLWTEGRLPLVRTLVLFDRIHDPVLVQPSEAEVHLILEGCDTGLSLTVRYDAGLYAQESALRWASHLGHLLRIVLFQPDEPLDRMELVGPEEQQLLGRFNETAAPYAADQTVHQLFEAVAAQNPDALAVACGAQRLTYRELNENANRLARLLQARGVGPDQLVAVMLERSPEMIVGILAVLKAGGAYVPIDPGYPPERISYLLADSQARLLLVRGAGPAGFAGEALDLTDPALYQGDSANLGATSGPRHLAYVIYTSGSTGQPKGAMIEHHMVLNRLQWGQKRYPLTAADVILQKTPFSFDVSVWELFWWAMTGASVAFLGPGEEKDPAAIAAAVEQHRVSVMHFVPSMLQLFLEYAEGGELTGQLRTLRRVFASGEALQVAQAHRFTRLLPQAQLVNLYGPTEATVEVSYHDCTGDASLVRIPIGRPIDNIALYVMDAHLRLQPVGVPGELCIGGVGVGRGYWNKPELTAEKFVDNPFRPGEKMYRTGDLARWLPSGEIEYLGRLDHQVKIRGFRIELGEVEAHLLSHEQIREAVVIARETQTGLQELCAYYVAGGAVSPGELRQFLEERLPTHMVPARFTALEAMPLTPNGKLDRKRLPEPQAGQQREYVAPRSELEAKLVEVWERELGVRQVSIDDRYFDIGGDSIKSIRVIWAINRLCETDLQLVDFYLHSTVRSLAELLAGGQRQKDDSLRAGAIARLELWKQDLLRQAEAPDMLTTGVEDFYPLSDIQQGMVYHSLSEPGAKLYHNQHFYQFKDDQFDENAFADALEALTARHPMLRTSFNLQDFAVPVQIVHERIRPDFERIELDGLSREEQEAEIHRVLEADLRTPFFRGGVSTGSLWRLRLFRLDAGRYAIGWCYHHAALDGWSNASFMTELSEAYLAMKAGRWQVRPLPHSYKELVIEQWALQDNEALAAYWSEELRDYRQLQTAPGIREASAAEQFTSTTVVLDDAVVADLKSYASRLDSTAKAACFAAYVAMLGSIDPENDFVTGLVENNRPLCEDGEKILGCYLNTVPVRVRIAREMTWLDLLRYLETRLTDLKRYGRISLSRIHQWVGGGAFDGNMLFDNFFNFADFHVFQRIDPKQRRQQHVRVDDFGRTNSNFDFECHMNGDQMILTVVAREAVYPKALVERLLVTFERALRLILEQPHAPVSKRELLPIGQIAALTERAERTSRPGGAEGTIHERFETQAARTPEYLALVVGGHKVTYVELNERANRVVRRLAARGVGPGSIVGLAAGRSVEMIVGLLAILKAGGAYLPIDPSYPPERIGQMLEDSGTEILLTQGSAAPRLQFAGEVLDLTDEAIYAGEGSNLGATSAPSDLAYCIYTSGSTGQPKGVLIEHRCVCNLLAGIRERIDFTPGRTIVSVTTISFDIFVLETLLPLMSGLTVVLATEEEQLDMGALGRLLLRHKAEIFQTTPSRMELMLNDETVAAGLATLQEILIGGEAFDLQMVEALRTRTQARIFNMYGPTETTVWSTVADLTDATELTLGEPIANTEILLLDRNGEIQPFGAAGELCIAGEGLARGYHNQPELTQLKFIPHPLDPHRRIYRTGDLAVWQVDGRIRFLGRLDHQVKVRGYRIELGEVEHTLAGYPGLQKPMVLARRPGSGEVSLVAYYLAENLLPVSELRDHLSSRLPAYMIPNAFVRLEEYPLLPNGKVNVKALREPDTIAHGENAEFATPQTLLEQELTSLWQVLLGRESIGVDQSFFELGGTSISLIQFHARLEWRYPGRVSIAELFSYPTVRKLAARLELAATERTVRIATLPLPARFRSAGESNGSATLRFFLPAGLAKRLAELAGLSGVATEDLLLAAYIYLFSEVSDQQAVTVQYLAPPGTLQAIAVDLAEIRDFPDLFTRVHEARRDRQDGCPQTAVYGLAFRNGEGEVAPLFYRHGQSGAGERYGELFGWALGWSDEDDSLLMTCEYDNRAIQQQPVEEWIQGYVKLLSVMATELTKEAERP